MVRTRRMVLIGMTFVLAVTGCSSGSDGSGDGSGEGGGDVLRVSLGTFGADSFDPIDMSTASAFDILSPMYDSLVGVDYDGKIAPAVAESWEVAPDQSEVTFTIRKGMKFHNGEDLTADDVKYSLLRWLDPELEASVVPPFALLLKNPEQDIQVVDDYTLRVTTGNGPAERFVSTVSTQQQHEAYILPMDYIEKEGTDYFREHPVGSGPWKFEKHTPGDSILFSRAEGKHLFRMTPAFEQLEIALVPEEATRLAALQTGEVDIIPISPESIQDVDEACCRVGEVEDAVLVHMFYSGSWSPDAGPTADVRVREALSLAIDRQEIVDQVIKGHGTPVPGTLPGEFFPGMAGMTADDWKGDVYDPDRAKELLAEAGYPDGFDIGVYSFEMSGAPYLASLATIFLGYWERIGVTGTVMPTDLDTFFDLSDQPNIDDRTIGTVTAFRRRFGYDAAQAVNGYFPGETPNASLVGLPGQTVIPNIEARVAEVAAASGDEKDKLAEAFLREVSELYLAPGLFYASALWGVGNNAGEWQTVSGSAQLGYVYETVQPRSG